ncbi:hypothetical protein IU449_26715 [Nocardia higoensis]|uniref:Uncharacterized protein n=1 Tax=Nocardia higoensis TaxID=228599 RepID=A0ABS0DI06_9NOCA|nr:hypothetical protein [Nocardia higoensis]MBF6358092.1 hypothetical protein [Nocardia higoensis]
MTDLAPATMWTKRYRWRKANGITLYVDATASRHHINELNALGVTNAMIADATGRSDNNIMLIANGANPRVLVDTERRILAVTHHPHPNQTFVLGIGAQRRLRALNAIGWPTTVIAERFGITAGALTNSVQREHITYSRWVELRDVYDELSGKPGPTPGLHRYFRDKPIPPLAWEGRDIDDPRAQPDWKAMGVKMQDRPVCPNGHPYRPDNVMVDNRGHRRCRTCKTASLRNRKRAA